MAVMRFDSAFEWGQEDMRWTASVSATAASTIASAFATSSIAGMRNISATNSV